MAKRTRKPCPGCGEAPEHDYLWRDADTVCDTCKRKLALVDEWTKANAKLREEGGAHVRLPRSISLYHSPRTTAAERAERQALEEALIELCAVCGEDVPSERLAEQWFRADESLDGDTANNGTGGDVVMMRRARIEALKKTLAAAKVCGKASYLSGEAHGRNALMRLATGDLSLKDFADEETQ